MYSPWYPPSGICRLAVLLAHARLRRSARDSRSARRRRCSRTRATPSSQSTRATTRSRRRARPGGRVRRAAGRLDLRRRTRRSPRLPGADIAAAIVLVCRDDIANPRRNSPGVEPEIHETRARRSRSSNASAREIHRVAISSRRSRAASAAAAREHHREVGGPVAERRVARTLEQRLDVLGRTDARAPPVSVRRGYGQRNSFGFVVVAGLAGLFGRRLRRGHAPTWLSSSTVDATRSTRATPDVTLP